MALTQKQLEANRRNAVKGGRPKGVRSIEKEKMKDYIAQKVAEHGEEIVAVLLRKMREGDIAAIRELFDRGFGKPGQEVRNEHIFKKSDIEKLSTEQLSDLLE